MASSQQHAFSHLHDLCWNRLHPVCGDTHMVIAVHQDLDDTRAGVAVPQHLHQGDSG